MRAYFAHRLHVQEQKAFSFRWLRPLTQRPEALPLDPAGVLPQTLNFRTAYDDSIAKNRPKLRLDDVRN